MLQCPNLGLDFEPASAMIRPRSSTCDCPVCLYVPAFVLGCIIGTEVAWSWLFRETLWAESLLWQQPLAIFAETFAVWLIASLAIAILTFAFFPPRSILSVLTRGTVCGFVFAIPMLGIGWLATYLPQLGSGLPRGLFIDSLLVRYPCYAALATCFDLLACLLAVKLRTSANQAMNRSRGDAVVDN